MPKQIFNSFKELQGLLPENKAVQEKPNKPKQIKTVKKSKKANPQFAPKPLREIDPKLQAIFDALNWLKLTFPKAFFSPPVKLIPLKIGISQDIAEYLKGLENPAHSLTLIRKALSMYTNNFRYLVASSKVNVARVDLQGNPAGEVTAEQVDYAQKKLAVLKERKHNKNAQTVLNEESNVVSDEKP